MPDYDPASARVLQVVDSHTCGQPTRVIVGGTGIAAGTDPRTAREELRERRDWIRRFTVLEPRGHRSMFAVVLIAPATADGEYGVVYMDAYGYPDLCGHATIGVGNDFIRTGFATSPDSRLLRTPRARTGNTRRTYRTARAAREWQS